MNEKLSLFFGYKGYIAEIAKKIVNVLNSQIFFISKA